MTQIAEQKTALAGEWQKQRSVSEEEAAALSRKIDQTKQQLQEIQQTLRLQERRVKLTENIVTQYCYLSKRG